MLEREIANKLIDCLIDKGFSELKRSLTSIDRRKMLKNSCELFAERTQFLSEFPNMIFVSEESELIKLSEEDLNPAKSNEEISTIIAPYVKKSFCSDEQQILESVVNNVSLYYKKRATVTIGLGDIVAKLDSMDESIDNSLEVIQKMLAQSRRNEELERVKKKKIYNRYIQGKVDDLIASFVKETYNLVFKRGDSFNGNTDSVTACLNHMKELINHSDPMLFDINYWNKPVDLIVGTDDKLKPIHEYVQPSDFIEVYKIKYSVMISDVLKHESILPEAVYYAIMELDLSMRNDLVMKYNCETAAAMRNVLFKPEDINSILVGWCNRAIEIGKYYHFELLEDN